MSESTNREAGEKLDFKPQRFTEKLQKNWELDTHDILKTPFFSLYFPVRTARLLQHMLVWGVGHHRDGHCRKGHSLLGGRADSGGGPSRVPLCRTVHLNWHKQGNQHSTVWLGLVQKCQWHDPVLVITQLCVGLYQLWKKRSLFSCDVLHFASR